MAKKGRAGLDEHEERFDRIDKRFDEVDEKLSAISESLPFTLRVSLQSSARSESVQRKLDTLDRRVQRLEERV